MRIIIFGATGQLGTDLVKKLEPGHDLFRYGSELDISNYRLVFEKFEEHQPEVAINVAAYTDVDACEELETKAFTINAAGAQNIALAARSLDAVIIYFSTDYVFNGRKNTPYHEYDQPDPINIYGLSKLAGEEMVQSFADKYFIIRTSWLHGITGNNFIKTIINKAVSESELRIVDDQIGSPTFTLDLAETIEKIITSERFGIYHIVNEGKVSWYELAKQALELYGLNNIEIKPVKTSEYPRPANRPPFSALESINLNQLDISLRPYKVALRDFINDLKKNGEA